MPRKIGGWRSTGSRPMSQLVQLVQLVHCFWPNVRCLTCADEIPEASAFFEAVEQCCNECCPKSWLYKISPAGLQKKGTETYGGLKTVRWPRVFPLKSAQSDDEKNPNLNHFLQLICSESSRFQHSWPSPNYLSSHWARSHHRSLRWRAAGGSRRGRETTAWPQNQPMQKPTWEPYKNQPLVAKKIGNLANWPSMTNTKQVKPRFLVLQWFHYHCLHAIPGALGSTVRHLILQVVHPLRGPEVDWRWLKPPGFTFPWFNGFQAPVLRFCIGKLAQRKSTKIHWWKDLAHRSSGNHLPRQEARNLPAELQRDLESQ